MNRLLLYINGILAIRTKLLDQAEAQERIDNWERIYGPCKIEKEQ